MHMKIELQVSVSSTIWWTDCDVRRRSMVSSGLCTLTWTRITATVSCTGSTRTREFLTWIFMKTGDTCSPEQDSLSRQEKKDAEGLKINMPVLPSTGDHPYLRGFREIVPPLVRAYKPQFIIAQCGADSHEDDMLAHL